MPEASVARPFREGDFGDLRGLDPAQRVHLVRSDAVTPVPRPCRRQVRERAARNFEISLWLIGSKTGPDGQPLLLATEISERGRNLLVDRELSKVVARLDLLAAQADEKYRRAALDFGQNWFLGSLGPLLAMVPK